MKFKLHWGAVIFALLWTLAACLPPVRESAHTMTASWRSGSGVDMFTLPPTSSDPIVVAWKLEREAPSSARLQKWDALVARHPDQPWLMAMCLRATLGGRSWWRGRRIASLKKEDVQTRTDFEEGVLLTKSEGQKDPGNAYWPWMEAGFRFVLGQRTQAVGALERAGEASHFEDYNQSMIRARVHWADQHNYLTWEERLGISYGQFFPDLSIMGASMGEAGLEAGRARTRGDNAEAIRIGAALLRADKLLARDAQPSFSVIIAHNVGYAVLEGVFNQKIHTNGLYEAQLADQSQLRERWGRFARANNRPDVAGYADWLEHNPSDALNGYYASEEWQQFGVRAPWGHIAVLVPVFLAGVFALCYGFALLWLVGRLLGREVGDGGPTRGQVTLCANFSFWAIVCVSLLQGLLIMGSRNGGLEMVLGSFFGSEEGLNKTFIPLLTLVLLVLGCWVLPVGFVQWKRGRRFRWVRPELKGAGLPRKFGWWRSGAWLFFFFFAAIIASDGNGMWDDTLLQPLVSGTLGILGLLVAIGLEVVRFRLVGWRFPRLRVESTPLASTVPRVWRWMRNGAFLFALAGFLGFWGTSDSWVTASSFALMCLGIGILGTVATVVLLIKTARPDRFFVQLARKTAGVLSLVWSFVFLLLALGTWPLRIELNRQLDRRLMMKEVDWMKEQVAKNLPASP